MIKEKYWTELQISAKKIPLNDYKCKSERKKVAPGSEKL